MIRTLFILTVLLSTLARCEELTLSQYQNIINKMPNFFTEGKWHVDGSEERTKDADGVVKDICKPKQDETVEFSKFYSTGTNAYYMKLTASQWVGFECDESEFFVVPFPVVASFEQVGHKQYYDDKFETFVHTLKIQETTDKTGFNVSLQYVRQSPGTSTQLHNISRIMLKEKLAAIVIPEKPKDSVTPVPREKFFVGPWSVVQNSKYVPDGRIQIGTPITCCMPKRRFTVSLNSSNENQLLMQAEDGWIGARCKDAKLTKSSIIPINIPASDSYLNIRPSMTLDDMPLPTMILDEDTYYGFTAENFKYDTLFADSTRHETLALSMYLTQKSKGSSCSINLIRPAQDKDYKPSKDVQIPASSSVYVEYTTGASVKFGDASSDMMLGLSTSHSFIVNEARKCEDFSVTPKISVTTDPESSTDVTFKLPTMQVTGSSVIANAELGSLWKAKKVIQANSCSSNYLSKPGYKRGVIGLGIEGTARQNFDPSVKSFGIKLQPGRELHHFSGDLIFNPDATQSKNMKSMGTIDTDSNWKISGIEGVTYGTKKISSIIANNIVFDLNTAWSRVPKVLRDQIVNLLKEYYVYCSAQDSSDRYPYECQYHDDERTLPWLTFNLKNGQTLSMPPEAYLSRGYEYKKNYEFYLAIMPHNTNVVLENANDIVLGGLSLSRFMTVFNLDKPHIELYVPLAYAESRAIKEPKEQPSRTITMTHTFTPPPRRGSGGGGGPNGGGPNGGDPSEPSGPNKNPNNGFIDDYWPYILIAVILLVVIGVAAFCFIKKRKEQALVANINNESYVDANQYAKAYNGQYTPLPYAKVTPETPNEQSLSTNL